MTGNFKSVCFSVAVHGLAFAALFAFSVKAGSADVVSPSDPLLALLAEPDADPSKTAGLVGKASDLARGTPDGDTLEMPKFDSVELPPPPPDPEPEPATPQPADVPAVAEPAKPELAKKAEPPKSSEPKKPAKAESKKTQPPKPAKDSKPASGEKKSLKDWQKEQGKKNQGKSSSSGKKPGAGNSGKKTNVQIDTSKIGTGSGKGGKTFGVPDGTGGNGGEGGRAVATAQQAYAREVEQKLIRHLDNVLAQEPLKIASAIYVSVRLDIDARGNVRLLEVVGSPDAQVRDRISKAVARLGKFRAPPQGFAFVMKTGEIALHAR